MVSFHFCCLVFRFGKCPFPIPAEAHEKMLPMTIGINNNKV